MKFHYQHEVLTLPAEVLTAEADGTRLRVLLWLASDLSLAEKPRQLAKLADCDARAVKDALAFWREQGVLVGDAENSVPAMAAVQQAPKAAEPRKSEKTRLRRADELPSYTSTEIADLLESRAAMRAVVDEAQRILGKMFNPSEVNILVCMVDYLGMSEECVLMLLAHCKRIGKTNLRAIEKYAYTLADREVNIADAGALEEEFRLIEAMHSFEGEVRAMFGMKSRALTAKEGKLLRAWTSYGYDIEIVRIAYEITVNATGDASMAYAGAILDRWHAEGLRDREQILAAIEEEARQKQAKDKPTLGNSFDTDDFFEAALQRSFAESTENR